MLVRLRCLEGAWVHVLKVLPPGPDTFGVGSRALSKLFHRDSVQQGRDAKDKDARGVRLNLVYLALLEHHVGRVAH